MFTIAPEVQNLTLFRRKKMKKIFLMLLIFSFFGATQVLAQDKEAPKEAHHGKTADELAKELNNPNNDVAKLTFKNQYRWYTGDLPDADSQDNYTLLFQPVFPFGLGQTEDHKSVLFFRPAIPFVSDQPVPAVKNGGFGWDTASGMGDIVFDLAYGRTYKSGWVGLAGIVGTLPAATDDDLKGKQLRLGPEAVFGYVQKWGLLAVFPSHQWDVYGWSEGEDYDYNTTTLQTFAMFTPGGGWSVGTQPIMTYDWENEHWTVPLNLFISKTVLFDKMPFKFDLDINYYVEQPDDFGPEWMVGFNISPIVPNFISNWIRGK